MCIRDRLESVIQRKVGIMEGVQENAPNVEFVADATAADQTEGMTATENFLQAHPELRIVCGVSDGAALGAYEAFKAVSYTHLDVYKRQILERLIDGPPSYVWDFFVP